MPSPLENRRDIFRRELTAALEMRDKLKLAQAVELDDPLQFDRYKQKLAINEAEITRLHTTLNELNQKLNLPAEPLPTDEETAPAVRPAGLSFKQFGELVDYLLACPALSDQGRRASVVSELPPDLRNNIHFKARSSGKEEVAALVQTCLNFPQGLADLLEIISFYDKDTLPLAALQTYLAELNLNADG